MKRHILLVIAICLVSLTMASNTLSFSSVSGTPQTEVEITVDLDNSDAVQMLVNSNVYIEKAHQEELGDDEVSLHYFIGFQIIDSENEEIIGTIIDIDDNTENWLFIVEKVNGEEVMIPAHEEFITDIQQEKKIMSMDLPLGLLEL